MLRYVLLAAITLTAVLADEGSDYTFNYKLPKISADMVLKFKDKLKHRIVEVAKDMEEECKYVKAMGQYGYSIEMALLVGNGGCSTDEHITQLDTYKKTYRTSLISCFEEMNSTAAFEALIDEIVTQIEQIDQAAKSEADACAGDEECEKQVYTNTHTTMSELYASNIAELKVAEDQALVEALSGIATCMIPKVSDSLKGMYVAIETLQKCIDDGLEAKAIANANKHSE